MTSISPDPKGYYAALGLVPGADMAAIKAAYRRRVKSVHPDRNRSDGAREEFQRLVEAYQVLKDVVHRAEYDATGVHPLTEDGDDYPSTPFACSCCGAVTAQPRYVIFHQVKSFLLWAKRSRSEGIFCRDCADATAVRTSLATWLQGWWSPPGLALAPLALLRNLFGGSKPRDQNARLLIRQARAFLALDEIDIARGLAEQAARFARLPVHKRQIDDLRKATIGSTRRMRDRWSPFSGGVFAAQALPLLALPVVVGIFVLVAARPWERPVSTSAGITVKPAGIGDIRHVAIADLKLRQAPADGAPVLALLDRFTTVQVLATEGAEWSQVRSPAGVAGWVPTRALYAGSGSLFKQEWCAANRGAPAQAGEVLLRRASGEHRLLIHNDGREDAVVKLKTISGGNTVVAWYIPATYHMTVSGIPDGTYRIEFAAGTAYSRGCGIFAGDMRAGLMPFTLTYRQVSTARAQVLTAIPEISLVAPPDDPRQPQALDVDRFAADD